MRINDLKNMVEQARTLMYQKNACVILIFTDAKYNRSLFFILQVKCRISFVNEDLH